MRFLSICLVSFIGLILVRVRLFFIGLIFLINDFSTFVEWELITLNSGSVVITFLFD